MFLWHGITFFFFSGGGEGLLATVVTTTRIVGRRRGRRNEHNKEQPVRLKKNQTVPGRTVFKLTREGKVHDEISEKKGERRGNE